MAPDDTTLLHDFISRRDGAAFRELVERHLPLVHATARRVTANEELARDVSQETFIRLAGRADGIPASVPLAAWLHRTTRSLAANLVRAEVRRKHREKASVDEVGSSAACGWSDLAPVIDSLVNQLPATDRHLILLRFYEGHSHATVATRIGLTEDATRQRSVRALAKLRDLLSRRGITTTASALGAMLPSHAVGAVPPGMAGPLAGVALASKSTGPGGLMARVLFMNKTAKTVAAVILIGLLATGIATYPWENASPTPPRVSSAGGPPDRLGVLRQEENTVGGVLPSSAVRPKRPKLAGRTASNASDEELADDLISEVDTAIPVGSSLVMGGQATADEGRSFFVITPEWIKDEDGSKAAKIVCRMLTLDSEDVAQAGLGTLLTDERKLQQNAEIWSAEDAEKTFAVVKQGAMTTAPTVMAGLNQPASVEIGTFQKFVKLEMQVSETAEGGFQLKSVAKKRE